jgi:hypothetical protein
VGINERCSHTKGHPVANLAIWVGVHYVVQSQGKSGRGRKRQGNERPTGTQCKRDSRCAFEVEIRKKVGVGGEEEDRGGIKPELERNGR